MTPIACSPARRRATALSTPPLMATAIRLGSGSARNTCCERIRERVGGKRLARHGGRLEQRQPGEGAVEAGRVGRDDPVAVDRQPDERELVAARGVSDHLEHRELRVAALAAGRCAADLDGALELRLARDATLCYVASRVNVNQQSRQGSPSPV